MSTSVIGSAAMITQRTGGSAAADPLAHPIPEDIGIGEEERRIESVQDEARDLARIRVVGQVVVALDPVGAAEHRVVRPPRTPDEGEERQRDGEEDALDDADERDTEEAREGEPELGRPDAPQADHRADVDERQPGGDDDRGERGGRQVGEEPGAATSTTPMASAPRRSRSAGSAPRPPRRPASATRCC